MAWVIGGKKFGQYTYEHWFDEAENEMRKPPESEPEKNSEQDKKEISGEKTQDKNQR